MSYRDLEGEDPAEVEHAAEVIDAPDPARIDDNLDDPGQLGGEQGGHQEPVGPATDRRGRRVALGIAVALLAAGGWYVYDRQANEPQSSPAPVVTASAAPDPGPAPAPEASRPTTAPTTLEPPMGVPPPKTGPAATRAPGGSVVTSALNAVRAFIPAWTLKGTPAQRRAALTPVTTTRLVGALADVRAVDLPVITGDPRIESATAAAVVVALPTGDGTGLLTVEPIDGRWLVTGVSLAP